VWFECLALGRIPDASESPKVAEALQVVGGAKRLTQVLLARHGSERLEKAERDRRSDILVYLALRLFQRRSRLGDLEGRIRRDIRAFFSSISKASDEASALLREIGNLAKMSEAFEQAEAEGLGYLDRDEHLTLHSALVPALAPVLRVYVGAGAALAGDVAEMDLVKMHLRSGKISFMKYDRFLDVPLPKMLQRLKVNLRAQTEQLFKYGGEYPEPNLYLKSRFMNEELDGYSVQVAFDKQISSLGLDLSGYGPSVKEFQEELKRQRLEIQGFNLVKSTRVPDLDEVCGRYLTMGVSSNVARRDLA
jgi:DNA phosphorothioation-associated putative methyltransferase